MIIRLVGNASAYLSELRSAQAATQKFVAAASSAFRGIAGSKVLSGLFDAFAEAERASLRLTSAIEASGHSVDEVMPKYKEFIDRVMGVTLMSRNTTSRLLEQAEAMGFTGDQALQIATNAIALGKGNDELALSAFRVAVVMERGHPEMVRRLMNLQGVKTGTELLVAIQEKLRAGLAVAAAEAGSTSGSLERLQRSFLALRVEVGGIIAQGLRPVITWLGEAIHWFNTLDPLARKVAIAAVLVTAGLAAMAPVMAILSFLAAPFITLLTTMFDIVVFLANPLTILVGIIGVFGAALASILTGTSFQDVAAWAMEAVGSVRAFLVATINNVKGFIENLTRNMRILMVWLIFQWARFSAWVEEVWGVILFVTDAAIFKIMDITYQLVPNFDDIWAKVLKGSATAWETAVDYARRFVMGTLGFLTNFGDNMGRLFDWLSRNWVNIWTDITILSKKTCEAISNNFYVVFQTITRLQVAFMAWLAGRMGQLAKDIGSKFLAGFAGVLPYLYKWSYAVGEMIGGALSGKNPKKKLMDDFFKDLPKDMKDALKEEDFFKVASGILKEQMAKLQNPLEGFKSTIEKLPDFNLNVNGIELPKFVFDQAKKAAEDAGKGGLEIGKLFSKGVEKGLGRFDAVAIASAEAVSRITEFRDKLGDQLEGKRGALARGGIAAPANSAEANTRRDDAATVLKEIRDILKNQAGAKVPFFPAGL
jgi:hypothetical protein